MSRKQRRAAGPPGANSPAALFNAAVAHHQTGALIEAERQYRHILNLAPNHADSLHNLGLIYYETENYEKAAIAFEQALKLEDELAARHVAYAKVQEKMGNTKLMLQELERAVELEPNKETFTLLHKAYLGSGKQAEAYMIEQRLQKLIVPAGRPKRIIRPRRVVV